MNSTDNVFTAYHVNDRKRCEEFIRNPSNLIISKDTYWLGDGMYFWDNESNANYWLAEKRRKNTKEEYVKTKNKLIFDDDILLDLTSEEVLKRVDEIWTTYKKVVKLEKEIPLGKRINVLYEFFNEEFENFKVIKAHGYYANRFNRFNLLNTNSQGPMVCSGIKTIYCTREPETVINRSIKE